MPRWQQVRTTQHRSGHFRETVTWHGVRPTWRRGPTICWYEPRSADVSALYLVVRDHLETFRAQAGHVCNGEGLPRFARGGVRGLLALWIPCGRLRTFSLRRMWPGSSRPLFLQGTGSVPQLCRAPDGRERRASGGPCVSSGPRAPGRWGRTPPGERGSVSRQRPSPPRSPRPSVTLGPGERGSGGTRVDTTAIESALGAVDAAELRPNFRGLPRDFGKVGQ